MPVIMNDIFVSCKKDKYSVGFFYTDNLEMGFYSAMYGCFTDDYDTNVRKVRAWVFAVMSTELSISLADHEQLSKMPQI